MGHLSKLFVKYQHLIKALQPEITCLEEILHSIPLSETTETADKIDVVHNLSKRISNELSWKSGLLKDKTSHLMPWKHLESTHSFSDESCIKVYGNS